MSALLEAKSHGRQYQPPDHNPHCWLVAVRGLERQQDVFYISPVLSDQGQALAERVHSGFSPSPGSAPLPHLPRAPPSAPLPRASYLRLQSMPQTWQALRYTDSLRNRNVTGAFQANCVLGVAGFLLRISGRLPGIVIPCRIHTGIHLESHSGTQCPSQHRL